MKKANIITILLLLSSLVTFSQDAHQYFATISENETIEIQCKLADFGSIYKISQTFGVSLDEIANYNKIEDFNTIKSDKIIKVKINNILQSKQNTGSLPIYYKVKSGETLYRIAKTYLNQNINDFMERNQMADHTIKKDNVFIIGYLRSTKSLEIDLATSEVNSRDTIDTSTIELPKVTFIKQKGIAYVNGRNNAQKGYYVLHSQAEPNSEIEIYNPMGRRTVKAKVKGRIPDGIYNSDINVVLSSATAKSLGALDARFMVEIKYVQKED
jgi:LysM repeat protein